MLLSFLFVLATPNIGPPPKVGPLKPLELGFDEDEPGPDPGPDEDEFVLPPDSEELLDDEPPGEEFPESPFEPGLLAPPGPPNPP